LYLNSNLPKEIQTIVNQYVMLSFADHFQKIVSSGKISGTCHQKKCSVTLTLKYDRCGFFLDSPLCKFPLGHPRMFLEYISSDILKIFPYLVPKNMNCIYQSSCRYSNGLAIISGMIENYIYVARNNVLICL